MASDHPIGGESKDTATSNGKVHIQAEDGQEEFAEEKRHSTSDMMSLQQSMVTAPGDVINSGTLSTSTDVSDKAEEMRSSKNATEISENCDETETVTLTNDVNTDENVIGDVIQSSRDEAENMTSETVEKERDELKGEETEHDDRNDVRDEVKAEVNVEARDVVEEASEESMDESWDVVRDVVKDEADEEARDDAQEEANVKSMDDNKDTVRDETKAEAQEEANVNSMDENKDTVTGEVKADTCEESRDETKHTEDIDSPETNNQVCDDTKGGTREMDADGSEVRDGKSSDVSQEDCKEEEESHGTTVQDQNEDDSTISIDEGIWRYILKTKHWMSHINRLKEGLGVEIEESTSGDGMRLRVSGSVTTNVERAEAEMRSLISECQIVVRTIEVPCEDNLVHSKIVRLLKLINKLPCYVSAAPELLRVTGTMEEIRSCLGKLETYGVHHELERKDDIPEVEIPPEEPEIPPHQNSQPQGSLTRELPVPIEKHLWHFIREKRKSELREIEEGFGVTISTKKTNNVATVIVALSVLSSDSAQLLDLAQQALGQLLERLGLQVVVTCVLGGEGVAKMPPEVLNILRQDLADVDVILEVIESANDQRPGHRLLLVGPDKEIALSQQTIKSAFEKMCNNVDPGMFNGNENFGGMPNAQQMFPGTGNVLGSKPRPSPGSTTATRGAPFQDTPSTKSVKPGPVGPNSAVDTSKRHSEPKLDRGTPLQEVPVTSQAPTKRAEDVASKKSPEQRTESSKAEEVKPAKGKKVTFADQNDGIRVYPSDAPHRTLDPSEKDTESDVTNRPEQEERLHSENTGSGAREKSTDLSSTTDGRHISLCSTCKDVSEAQRASGCSHVICLACVRDYVDPAASCCPLCGNSGRPTAAATQPIGGQMLVTFNNACRLPGLENNSKGIIIITYVFKQGYQTGDCPNPGKPYPDLTKTAFLPLSPVGSEVLDLLQKAFEARVTFRFASTPAHPSGELVWNDILHKENIYGGPKVGGYPDPIYMERVRRDLLAKGFQ